MLTLSMKPMSECKLYSDGGDQVFLQSGKRTHYSLGAYFSELNNAVPETDTIAIRTLSTYQGVGTCVTTTEH